MESLPETDKFEGKKEYESVNESLRRKFGLNQIIGTSRTTMELREKIRRISSCDVTVLISGESGTGKELVARAIHYLSHRAGKPFIPVHCGALPENLFENELFGHVEGAFTGARIKQTGLVKEADGGTLFLDEIGTVSSFIQTKFLRLLQDKEYKPLGSSKLQKADIRITAATNVDLLSLVKEGKFREDLFYRLNIVSVHLPPLRERVEDIPILMECFLKKYSQKYNKPLINIFTDRMHEFLTYRWPGNVRELENTIQKLIVMSNDLDINAQNLPASISINNDPEFECFNSAKKRTIEAFEKSYLFKLLRENKGDMIIAAKKAGKSRTALWNLLKKHNLHPTDILQSADNQQI